MEKIEYLIRILCDERQLLPPSLTEENSFDIYRSLVNVREPGEIGEEYLRTEDEVLKKAILEKGITDVRMLKAVEPHIFLWQGDITTLKCDAVVNAANSGMTGCYAPCHNCIDNCIHTFAGVRLRLSCDRLMKMQGFPEPVGRAKITDAFNLPSRYVIHTVGPQVANGEPTPTQQKELASCYRSCMETAVEYGCGNIAFCCISTGVFGYPGKEAARIAVDEVRSFVRSHELNVIFNVFTDEDKNNYRSVLGIDE